MPSDEPTPEVLAAAIRNLAAVVERLVIRRGQVAHMDLDLRKKLAAVDRATPPDGVRMPPASAAIGG